MAENDQESKLYLSVEGNEHDGYWIEGDHAGIELLQGKCREAIESPNRESSINVPSADIVGIVLRERPAAAQPGKVRATVNAVIGFLILAMLVVTLARGCVALQKDVQNFQNRTAR